jgi:hypothetical protein
MLLWHSTSYSCPNLPILLAGLLLYFHGIVRHVLTLLSFHAAGVYLEVYLEQPCHLVSSCELLQSQCGVDLMIAVNLSVVFNVGCGFTTVLWQVSIQGVLLRSFQAVSTHALR